jgi:hypothetical protein
MKLAYQGLYDDMLDHIGRIEGSDLSETEKIETCFRICTDCWNELKTLVKAQRFADQAAEILFFKFIKPRFTGHIEFYIQCYQSMLFKPSGRDPTILLGFWEHEIQKIDQFYTDHADFCVYYLSSATDRDAHYFAKIGSPGGNGWAGRIYDVDSELTSSYDHLAATLVACQLYHEYVGRAIAQILHTKEGH